MKKNNKRLDFLPNIQNKYSIRKFTVGTASILVSSLLFLGISHDASASTEEPNAETTATTPDNAPSNENAKPADTTVKETPQDTAAPAQQDVNNTADTVSAPDQSATPAQPKAEPEAEKAEPKVDTNDAAPAEKAESKNDTNAVAPAQPKNNKVATRAAEVPGSSLNASDDIVGSNPTVQTGVSNAKDLPALTNDQVKNVNNQITWLDFSDPTAITNPGFSDNGQLALKVGTKYEKEVMPGLVVTATVKSLQPFEATPMYARRADGDPNSGYDPNAQNIIRKDSKNGDVDQPAYVVVTPQDSNWSHLKKAGIDTGSKLTNFGSNKDFGNVGATFDVKATYNGVEVPANIVMADGEEAKQTEALIYTTNGSGWKLFANVKRDGNPDNYVPLTKDNGYLTDTVDNGGHGKGKYYATPDAAFGGLGTQIFGPNQTQQDQKSVPIVVTTGATEVSFFVNSAGKQTVQMGFVILDKGDAPDSYGDVIHAIAEGSNVSQPFLGTQKADIDFDELGKQYKNWETDDINTPNSVKDPDEGEKQLVGVTDKYVVYNAADQSYSLDVIANTADNDTSYVRGWVDFNDNGVFDEKEGSELVTVSRTGADGKKITLTFKNIPQLTDDALDYLGVRVRTSLAKGSVNRPNGVAYSGEIEDFEIRVVHPPRGEKSETTGFQGQPQTSKAVFTAHGRVDKDWPKVNEIDTTKDIKIVDDQGNLVSTLTVPGEGTYTVAPDGKVTFTPEPQFKGEGKGVDVKRVDKNGTPVTAKYTPKVNEVIPTAKPAETTGVQGQPQTGTPVFEGGDPLVPIDETVAPKLIYPETGNEVDNVTVPSEGTYTVDPDGKVTFTPDPQFKGEGKGVEVKRVDNNGTPVTAKYTPSVTPVDPKGTPATSTGLQGQPQEGTPVFEGGDPLVPIDETVAPKLVDPKTGNEVDKVVIPGEGTYTIDPSGKVTFTPDPQFKGEGKGVEVKRVDNNGTPVTAKYTPSVTAVTPKGTPATSTGVQGQPQTGTPKFEGGDPLVPIDETVVPKLIDPNTGKEVDKVVIPGEGTYTIDPSGKVTFTPDPNFTGEGKGVVVKRVDKNGTVVTAKYTPTVKATPKTKPTPTKPVVPEGKTPVKKDKVITSNEDEANTVAPEKQAKKAQPATDKAETKHQKAASANRAKALPKTGNEDNNANTTLLGSILALFGLAAFSRRKKEDK